MFDALPTGPCDGHVWPDPPQRLLLDASLRRGEEACTAFAAWTDAIDVEQPFDWQMVRLLPLAYTNLQRAESRHPMMARLRGVYKRAWVESHTLRDRMTPVVAALQSRGVRVLLLKGAALATAYYPNACLRPMSDLDLAVEPASLDLAMQVLRELGWLPTAFLSTSRRRWTHALQFVHPSGGELDLHWRLMHEADDAVTSQVFATAESVRYGTSDVLVPDPTCMLLHTVVHAMRWNSAAPFRWIPDAHQIMARASEIDWDRFVELAIRVRCTYRVRLAVEYLAHREGLPVPAGVIAALAKVRPGWQERHEARAILADQSRWPAQLQYQYWLLWAHWVRVTPSSWGPLRSLWQFPHFLVFHFDLGGRRALLPIVWRGVRRRLPSAAVTAATVP